MLALTCLINQQAGGEKVLHANAEADSTARPDDHGHSAERGGCGGMQALRLAQHGAALSSCGALSAWPDNHMRASLELSRGGYMSFPLIDSA